MSSTEVEDCAHGLRVGELVEVKSPGEIFATLDSTCAVEAMPFMPEMLQFAGKRFRVFKRLNKACDTIDKTGLRRIDNAVLLEGVRCDGVAHDGCQAGCLLFWKEQWLKRVPQDRETRIPLLTIQASSGKPSALDADHQHVKIRAALMAGARTSRADQQPGEEIYRCQITELKAASSVLPWWDLRQYVQDVKSGNRKLGEVVRGLLIMLFNWSQGLRGGVPYPYMAQGTLKKTPVANSQLQVGEVVRVRSEQEIMDTLDTNNKNRGLWFDISMLRFCGETFRVARRVHRIVHEKTGRMLRLAEDNPVILLEGNVCYADYYHKFCPRSEYLFWREIWLERMSSKKNVNTSEEGAAKS